MSETEREKTRQGRHKDKDEKGSETERGKDKTREVEHANGKAPDLGGVEPSQPETETVSSDMSWLSTALCSNILVLFHYLF